MKCRADSMTAAQIGGLWSDCRTYESGVEVMRSLFAQHPDVADELAQVRADITRTAAVAAASRPSEVPYPQGFQQIAGNASMHFGAIRELEALLCRERELLASKDVQS